MKKIFNKKILAIICLTLVLIIISTEADAGFWSSCWNGIKGAAKAVGKGAIAIGATAVAVAAVASAPVALIAAGAVAVGMAAWGAYQAIAGSNIFLETLNDYMNNGGCWFCSTFANLFKAINNLATSMFERLTELSLILLGFGLLFIILFKVGRMLIQLQEVNLMQFMQDLFKPLGRAMIASALLTTFWVGNSIADDNIFSILISPFLDLAFHLSRTITLTIIG